MIICPYCEEGEIWEINIESYKNEFLMCFECDTIWNTNDDINIHTGCSYEFFFVNKKLKPDWSIIKKIKKFSSEK